jgi:hypothetical protein
MAANNPAATAAKAKPAAAPAATAAKASVEITYVPGRDDPVSVVWNKLTFEANKPRDVSDSRIIERAKSNPWFRVSGEKRADKGFDPNADKPVNATQYRAYAITWFKMAKTAADLEKRWSDEEAMRTECEVGTDDLEYIARYYDPQLEQLKKMEAAGEAQ